MVDKMMISDLQGEILEMQIDISAMESLSTCDEDSKLSAFSIDNSSSCATTFESNKVDLMPPDLFDALKADDNKFELDKVSFRPQLSTPSADIKSEIKDDPDLITATFQPIDGNKKFGSVTPMPKPVLNDAFATSMDAIQTNECKQAMHKFISKDSNHCMLMKNHNNEDPKQHDDDSHYDVKKEIEQLDIEAEITPSYIIKKSDQSIQRSASPPELNLDYLCGTVSSGPSSIERNRKDELISSEPYDEWLCIQKELNLINDKRDSYGSSSSNTNMDHKLSVENQLDDLFNHQPVIVDMNDKAGIANMVHGAQSPLSELFNDSIVASTIDNVTIDKTLENRLENMFTETGEFEKTNDLVETRLEELFHGSASPTALSGQMSQEDAYHHINNQIHDNVDLLLQETDEMMTHHNNKRQWPQNVSSCMQPSEKRSCMVSSYMETTNASVVDQHWMMDCQQQPFDFMANDNSTDHHLNHHDTGKGLVTWNGHDGSSNGSSAADNLIMSQIDMKKGAYSNAIKNHDLERDLLGLSTSSSPISMDSTLLSHHHHQQQQIQTHHPSLEQQSQHNHINQHHQHHLHNDNSYDTSTMSANGNTNTSNNSLSSNFDDDINRHVQNAIDSILNLQNSEADSLHYQLDQSMASFMVDNPLTVPQISFPNSTNRSHHTSPHQVHPTLNHYSNNAPQMHKRRMNQYDDTSDCLISGGHSIADSHVDMMMDSPPILQQTNDMTNMSSAASSVADFIDIDDPVKSIITS